MTVRFYSSPPWELGKPNAETLEPQNIEPELITEAFARSEYRGERPLVKAGKVLEGGRKGPFVFAQPPKDLPALLRLADQLIMLARQEAGERAKVWRCECGTRYAVPVALLRPVAIKCERCWHWRDGVGRDPEHPTICGRCTDNLFGAGEARSVA